MKEVIFGWLGKVPYGEYLQNDYFISALILIAAIVGARILLFIFEKYLERFAEKTKTNVDNLIFERTKKPLFYLILAYGLKLALTNLDFDGTVSKIVNSLMALVFIFILARAVNVIIEVWGKAFAKRTKSRLDDVLLPLFHKTVNIVFVIIAFMWVLDIWQIDVTPYLAGVGVSGLVLGFALQDSLKNIFGGVTLLLDKTYQIGDKVKLESGEVGTILDIGLRSTKMRTYDNELIYIPNGYLANSRVQNYTRPTAKIRVNVNFGVEYGSKVEKVQKAILRTVKKMDEIMDDPEPTVQFLEFGESSLNFVARFWVERWENAYAKKLEATEKIYDALNKAKIGIPFPTRTVYVRK